MKDIETRSDIELFSRNFYNRALADKEIGFIFSEVAKLDLEKHLPVINDFWESVIFNNGLYKGNVLQTHQNLNQKFKLEKKHFDKWLELFLDVVDEKFHGPNATIVKNRALSIATVIQMKL